MKKRILAVMMAALLAVLSFGSALPVLAKVEKPAARYETPAGYNDHDYQKLVAFLETEDENGVKNGLKVSRSYDPVAPETWNGYGIVGLAYHYVGWNDSEVKQLTYFEAPDCSLYGQLDLSGCTENRTIDVSGNALSLIDVSGSEKLSAFDCSFNALTGIDVSGCAELRSLDCRGNQLTQLDLTSTPLPLGRIIAEDGGYVSYRQNPIYSYTVIEGDTIYAEPFEGVGVLGWYSEDGTRLTRLDYLNADSFPDPVIAKFGEQGGEPQHYDTPEGCCDREYQMMADFLESKNEYHIQYKWYLNEDIDMTDVDTWGYYYSDYNFFGIIWNGEAERKVTHIRISDLHGIGSMDVSDFTELRYLRIEDNGFSALDISGCASLYSLVCWNNELEALDISDSPELVGFNCGGNRLTELDVSVNTKLESLYCNDNMLETIDTSLIENLWYFDCSGNPMTDIDLTSNTILYFDTLHADGNGYVGCYACDDWGVTMAYAYAYPKEGATFVGWYNDEGQFITDEYELPYYYATQGMGISAKNLIACFEGGFVEGDATGDGEVDTTDALLVMRCALGITEDENVEANCDMDGNGSIDTTDALIIMRIALHII